MANKEATARIKINKLLEAAGWRFFVDGNAHANIRLEPSVTIKSSDLDQCGIFLSVRYPVPSHDATLQEHRVLAVWACCHSTPFRANCQVVLEPTSP